MDFVTKEDLEGGLTVDRLNELLTRVYNLVIEKTLCNLPELLLHMSRRTESLQRLTTSFFAAHPELAKDKDVVAKILQSLELQLPGATPEELFAKIPAAYERYKNASTKVTTTDLDIASIDKNINGVL